MRDDVGKNGLVTVGRCARGRGEQEQERERSGGVHGEHLGESGSSGYHERMPVPKPVNSEKPHEREMTVLETERERVQSRMMLQQVAGEEVET